MLNDQVSRAGREAMQAIADAAAGSDIAPEEDPLDRILAAVELPPITLTMRPLPALEDQLDEPPDPVARAAAVAHFRRIADKLESGELRGARCAWREGWKNVETVESDEAAREVRYRRHPTE